MRDNGAETVCCSRGSRNVLVETVVGKTSLSVCSDLPVGSRCHGIDSLCATRNCGSNNTCAELSPAGEPCEKGSHCNSGHCGLFSDILRPSKLCCEGPSSYISVFNENDFSGPTTSDVTNAAVADNTGATEEDEEITAGDWIAYKDVDANMYYYYNNVMIIIIPFFEGIPAGGDYLVT